MFRADCKGAACSRIRFLCLLSPESLFGCIDRYLPVRQWVEHRRSRRDGARRDPISIWLLIRTQSETYQTASSLSSLHPRLRTRLGATGCSASSPGHTFSAILARLHSTLPRTAKNKRRPSNFIINFYFDLAMQSCNRTVSVGKGTAGVSSVARRRS